MKKNAGDVKQEWVRAHAARLFLDWRRRTKPFAISPEYVRKLERDLAHYYEQPLIKAFVENTD